MRGCSRFCRPIERLFFVEIPLTPSRFATAPRGMPLSSKTPSGISVLRAALEITKKTAFSGNGLVRGKADFTDEMFKNADSSGKRLIFRTNLRSCLLIC